MQKRYRAGRRTLFIARAAFGAALFSLCAWLMIPFPVPITMQTFGLFLFLFLFGGKCTLFSLSVYFALGAMGLPVFSGFGGGVGILIGPSGGYLFGFLATVALYTLLTHFHLPRMLSAGVGLIGCYAVGVLWYAIFYAAGRGFWEIATVTVLPFLMPDTVKLLLAAAVSAVLKKEKVVL